MNARRAFLGASGLLLAACAGLMPRLKSPEVTLAKVRLVGATLFEQRFVLTLRVHNPNDLEIPVERLSFTLDINAEPFAEGASTQPVLIPALGEALVDVTVSTSLASFLRQWKDGKTPLDALAYRIKGRIESGRYGGFDFDRKGTVGK